MQNKIHDLLFQDDKIVLICNHQDKIVSYIIDEQKLYLNYNLPFSYEESIKLSIKNMDIKIITHPLNIADNIKLNMYTLSEKVLI